MARSSLAHRRHPLADPNGQLRVLSAGDRCDVRPFDEALAAHGLAPLHAATVETLQVNVGKVCNQTCEHCHVDAGPDRKESMPRLVAEACIRFLEQSGAGVLDITGGAPEMNPNFRWLASEGRRLGRRVIDRCNLTILLAPGFEDLPEFLAEQRVEVVASLPCYLEENCDRQRGAGVFRRSIEALGRLNALGYGRRSDLPLALVYNPVGPSAPPPQAELESAYRQQLRDRFGIEFTNLYTITNMPISRFLAELVETGRYEEYMQALVATFNPSAVAGLMCRTTLSVDWRGRLYDCDFNQMLGLPIAADAGRHIDEANADLLAGRPIVTARHCYGCTAGAGSGCQGAVVV